MHTGICMDESLCGSLEKITTLSTGYAPVQNKKLKKKNVDKDVKKREPSFTVGGTVNWCSHCGKQPGGSAKS